MAARNKFQKFLRQPLAGLKQVWRMGRYRRAGIVVEREIPSEVHGKGIGAWVVASGRLNSDSVVYSVGVGRELSLDLSLAAKYGCAVHCFDPTPVSAQWIREQTLPPQIVFHEVGLAAYDGELAFRMPRKAGSAHFSPIQRDASDREDEMVKAPVWRLETMMQKLGHDHIDLLKIDIEGGEYEVIEDIVRLGDKVGQLLMEFHHCYRSVPLGKTVVAVERLRESGFRIFSISPRTYEISFAQ